MVKFGFIHSSVLFATVLLVGSVVQAAGPSSGAKKVVISQNFTCEQIIAGQVLLAEPIQTETTQEVVTVVNGSLNDQSILIAKKGYAHYQFYASVYPHRIVEFYPYAVDPLTGQVFTRDQYKNDSSDFAVMPSKIISVYKFYNDNRYVISTDVGLWLSFYDEKSNKSVTQLIHLLDLNRLAPDQYEFIEASVVGVNYKSNTIDINYQLDGEAKQVSVFGANNYEFSTPRMVFDAPTQLAKIEYSMWWKLGFMRDPKYGRSVWPSVRANTI